MELLQSLGGEVQSRRSGCEILTRKLADCDAKVVKLELNIWLLMNETNQIGELQKRLVAAVGELGSVK